MPSKIVEAQQTFSDGTPHYVIEYTFPADFHAAQFRGVTLTGGIHLPEHPKAGDCVYFGRSCNAVVFKALGAKTKVNEVLLRINPQAPGLADLVEELHRRQYEADAPLRQKREAELAQRQELLAAMRQQEAELVAQIPADHIRVTAKQTGDCDGDPIMEYAAEGEKLNWTQITFQGAATAKWPKAMSAFAFEQVCSISRADIDAVRTARLEKARQAEEKAREAARKRQEAFDQAKATGEPVLLRQWGESVEEEDNSLDIVCEYAMPDGTVKRERSGTY